MQIRRYNEYKQNEQEFYFYLGFISTKFAVLEYNMLKLLGKLILDDFVITNNLFERNSLAQNVEFIKRIYEKRGFETVAIKELIDKVSNIRKTRNLFIHGLWGEPVSKDNDVKIFCGEPKMDHFKEFENGALKFEDWRSIKSNNFTLSYMKKLAQNIQDIITAQDYLLAKIEEHQFD